MRSLFYALTVAAVISMAFWAYHENYKTQEAQSRAEDLQLQISNARERLRMLRAEWAYLNRPDRLRDLAEINFDTLGLLPLQPHQFGRVAHVAEPQEDILIIENPIDVIEDRSEGGTFP
jgi:hypothetical protein